MSPDDHFANLKRLIQAVAGRAHRMTVIMPSLYGGRQHRRVVRESLDCAVALQELQSMGVQNIITFDAHDPRLEENADSADGDLYEYYHFGDIVVEVGYTSFDI